MPGCTFKQSNVHNSGVLQYTIGRRGSLTAVIRPSSISTWRMWRKGLLGKNRHLIFFSLRLYFFAVCSCHCKYTDRNVIQHDVGQKAKHPPLAPHTSGRTKAHGVAIFCFRPLFEGTGLKGVYFISRENRSFDSCYLRLQMKIKKLPQWAFISYHIWHS